MRIFCPAGCAYAVEVKSDSGTKAEAATALFNNVRRSIPIASLPLHSIEPRFAVWPTDVLGALKAPPGRTYRRPSAACLVMERMAALSRVQQPDPHTPTHINARARHADLLLQLATTRCSPPHCVAVRHSMNRDRAMPRRHH